MTRTTLTVLALVLLAAILRALYLGDKSVWLDEATSILLAQSDPLTAARSDIHALLYYRVLRIWLLLGDSEIAIRSLSVLWSVATVAVVFTIGRRLYGITEGAIAGVLLAVNAFHIAYAQEARSYSQAVFFVTLASLLFARALERPSPGRWAGYAVALLAAVFSHGYAALIVGAHLAALVFLPPGAVPWRSVMGSVGAVALLAVPSLAVAATFGSRGAAWIPPTGARDVYETLRSLAGFADLPLLLAYLLAVSLGLVAAGRTWAVAQASPVSFRYGLPAAWFAVPLIAAYTASSFVPVLPRYLMLVVPAMVLVAAPGLARIRPVALMALAITLITGLALGRVWTYYCCMGKEEWRDAAAAVLSRARDGDAIVFYSPYIQPAFDYYRTRWARAAPAPALEPVLEPAHLPPSNARTWLVVSHDETVEHTGSRRLRDALVARYGSFDEWRFNGVTVFLFPGGRRP
ncbi:MAG: glycosyltransferase family 39 protein [Armatimonadota bacterium]|nr:glycosyltransferase family 39 protein [Armatimonadota bacterium]